MIAVHLLLIFDELLVILNAVSMTAESNQREEDALPLLLG